MTVVDVLSKAVEADEAAGVALIDAVVYDFMADLVEVNKAELSAVYGMWALDRVQTAKKALAKSYVSSVSKGHYPADDMQQAAEWLAGIERFVAAAARGEVSKALNNEYWTVGNKRVQRRVARDAQGRFTRGINQNLSRAVSPADKDQLAPALRPFSNKVEWIGGMTPASAASFQGKYEEAVAVANEFKQAFKGNKADVVFLVQGPNGDIRSLHAPLKDVDRDKVDMPGLRADDNILGVELAPGAGATAEEAARVAEFNLLGGAGGSALAELANTDPKLRAQLASSLKMPTAAEDKSGLTRLFDVLAAGGSVLAGVGGAEKIGQMAALVGTMGPQAEQVLGPYVKRTAYRYRGTEKTPDAELRDPQASLRNEDVDALKRSFPMASSQSLEMHARADAASAFLAETIPQDPIIARLSEASGQVLPSQGVIYDQNGKLVSQSVGFTDDHYLPFDLSNLGRLRGGQYVRTRQQGGLTGEDVYTAVMSGARQVQVVSGSGVFTLEMAPDFRGARAMSDKARSMYTNYLKILDAVQASGLYLEDISPREKQKAFDDARSMLGANADEADVRQLAEANIERLRRESQGVDETDELLAASDALREAGGIQVDGESPLDAASRLRGRERRIFDDAYEERIAEIRSSKTNRLRLNGQGYAVALATLQQQFPYFIADVKFRELNKLPTDKKQNLPRTRAFAEDRGYAQPGSLRARGVRTGYFNPGEINPPPKRAPSVEAPVGDTREDTSPAVSAPAAASSAPAEKAPSVGVQARIDSNMVLDKSISETADEILVGLNGIPTTTRMAANPNRNLPFNSVANDKSAAVLWIMSQTDPMKAVEALNGPSVQAAADALTDRDAVRTAVSQVLAADPDIPMQDYFDSGRTIGGQSSLDGAVDWMLGAGRRLADLAAMKQGLVKEPGTVEQIVAHRGLMPLQMSGIGSISSKDEFRAFVASNELLGQGARALAFDGDEMRSIAEIAQVANEQLDALNAVKAAQDKALPDLRSAKDASALSPGNYITSGEWRKATGRDLPDSMQELMAFDVAREATTAQQAWSLAVTGRILDTMDGGGVYPKAGSRLLEPIGKAMRRPLVKPTGAPLVLPM